MFVVEGPTSVLEVVAEDLMEVPAFLDEGPEEVPDIVDEDPKRVLAFVGVAIEGISVVVAKCPEFVAEDPELVAEIPEGVLGFVSKCPGLLGFVAEGPGWVPEFVTGDPHGVPEDEPHILLELSSVGPSSGEGPLLFGCTVFNGNLSLRDVMYSVNILFVSFSMDILTGLRLHTVTLGNSSTE